MVERVLATGEALALIERLRARHGRLMFHKIGPLMQQGFLVLS